jgi:hypothetical protein
VQNVTSRHDHRLELERMVRAVGIGHGDGLQWRVVEGDTHLRGGLLVEAPVAADANGCNRNGLV